MIGFWCKISIELIWVAKYEKMGENHHFRSLPKTCTGTEQSGTGTVWVMVDFGQPVPVQVRDVPVSVMLYFSVSPRIRILTITCPLLIRFE